jgi:hypothetical protein
MLDSCAWRDSQENSSESSADLGRDVLDQKLNSKRIEGRKIHMELE